MMYPFMTLNDGTEIVHSEMLDGDVVRVYIEKPDAKDCFHSASCILPRYEWKDVQGFAPEEIENYQALIESVAHLIQRYAKGGGFENAAGF